MPPLNMSYLKKKNMNIKILWYGGTLNELDAAKKSLQYNQGPKAFSYCRNQIAIHCFRFFSDRKWFHSHRNSHHLYFSGE